MKIFAACLATLTMQVKSIVKDLANRFRPGGEDDDGPEPEPEEEEVTVEQDYVTFRAHGRTSSLPDVFLDILGDVERVGYKHGRLDRFSKVQRELLVRNATAKAKRTAPYLVLPSLGYS